jgi:hypothetical protein
MPEEHESSNALEETPAPSTVADVDMGDTTTNTAGDANADDSEMHFAGELPEARTTFMSYLASPIVTLIVGKEPVVLSAHQALLLRSPFFQEACKSFVEDGSVSRPCSRGHSTFANHSPRA